MWIAKDSDGSVNLFQTRPVLIHGAYYVVDVVCPFIRKFQLDERMFPGLTFEDGPVKVRLIIDEAKQEWYSTVIDSLEDDLM